MILSHGFIKEYEDRGIWEVCKQSDTDSQGLAAFGFKKIKGSERQAEIEAQLARNEANQRTEEAVKEAKRARLQAWVSSGTTDDGQASTSGSRPSTDNQSSSTQQS